ncbi:MAG: glycerol-3-phosphate 1-O-acyltransferase PlsY [Lachnospiraceae bacterium]
MLLIVRCICFLIGYIGGLFQTSYFYGRFKKIDIREHGSGNAGTTNALRTMGKKAGAITLLCDCVKCILVVLIVRALFADSYPGLNTYLLSIYAAAGCVIGHNYPFYLGFRGGKGVATTGGLALIIDWRAAVIGLSIFIIVVLVSKYVSLGSICAYLALLVSMIIFGQLGHYGMSQRYLIEFYCVMTALTALTLYKHRANIKRLLNGTENKISFGKKE